MLTLLLSNKPLVLVSIACLGLIIGSFSNVVIYRLPRMMQAAWQAEAYALLSRQVEEAQDSTTLNINNVQQDKRLLEPRAHTMPLNLAWPGSHCPACKHMLTWWQNIPLISFILLARRCAYCKQPIPWRYPLIELATALLGSFVIYHFGVNLPAAGALLLTWALIPLVAIDLEHQILPDEITLSLLWLGLLWSVLGGFVAPSDAILGAFFGYFSLWAFAHLFRIVRGKEGMGYGDFKLFATFGAWLGLHALLPLVLIACLLGIAIHIPLMLFQKTHRDVPFAFGPYLAISGWVMLCFGPLIIDHYQQFMQSWLV